MKSSNLSLFSDDDDETVSLPATTNGRLSELILLHESEVHKHRQRIAVLSRAANSRQPALSLPDELIVDVLLYYRDVSILIEESGNKQAKLDSTRWWWLVPTHICHRWRMIAHATPALWCHLDKNIFSKPQLFEAALQRSRQLPLDVSIEYLPFGLDKVTFEEYWSRDEKDGLGKILKEAYRIRQLHLTMPQSLIKTQMTKGTVLHPFAQLEDLRINASTPLGGGILIPAIYEAIPQTLRTLALSGVVVRWDAAKSFPVSLTSLEIDFPPSHQFGSYVDILNALEGLPRLECLCLHRLPLRFHPLEEPKAVNLACLKRLELSQSNAWDMLSIIDNLSFPPNIDATIKFVFSTNHVETEDGLASVFTKFGVSTAPKNVTDQDAIYTSLIFNPDNCELSFETSTETCTGSWPQYFKFSLFLHGYHLVLSSGRDFIEAISLTVYPVISNITIEGLGNVLSPEAFAMTFLQARNLERVQVDHDAAAGNLLNALRVLPNDVLPVPKLRTVTVRGSPREGHRLSHCIRPSYLCEVLNGRLEKGSKLDEFRIHASASLGSADLATWNQLKTLVNLVTIPLPL